MSEIESILQKLLNLARETKVDHQLLLTRLAGERFLARIAASPHKRRFIFKGGRLLQYLIESERRTVDLDFSVSQLNLEPEAVQTTVEEIVYLNMGDHFDFHGVKVEVLQTPHMPYPGARIKVGYRFGKVRGTIQADLGKGDQPDTFFLDLPVVRYKGKPLVGSDIALEVYTPEQIFSEKLHAVVNHGGQNSRMKDFYDLCKLIDSGRLDLHKLPSIITKTFGDRQTHLPRSISFSESEMQSLQILWSRFRTTQKLGDAVVDFSDVIVKMNDVIEGLI